MKASRYNYYHNNYVANTFSGSIIELEPYYLEMLKSNTDSLPGEILNTLSSEEYGIIVDDDKDESQIFKDAYRIYKNSKEQANIVVCSTLDCNFRCPYCFEEHLEGSHMDLNTQNALIEYVDKIIDNGISDIKFGWFGGEPLLNFETVKYVSTNVFKLCTQRDTKISFSITTNGYLISDSVIELFNSVPFDEVKITIDGDAKTHNERRFLFNGEPTFNTIVYNIRKLSTLPLYIKLRVNIDSENLDAFSHVKSIFAAQANVHPYPAIITKEDTQGKKQQSKCITHDQYESFYSYMSENCSFQPEFDKLFNCGVCSCMAEHYFSSIIDSRGYIYKCINDTGIIARACGTIFENEIFPRDKKINRRDPFSEEECNTCVFLPLCYGGCYNEYLKTGSHACPSVKYIFHKILEKKINNASGNG